MEEINKREGLTRRSAIGLGVGAIGASIGLPTRVFGQTGGDVSAAVAYAKDHMPRSTQAIIDGAAKEGKLVLSLQEFGDEHQTQALIDKFKERFPFVDVEFTLQNGMQLQKKFTAEVNSRRGISDYVHLNTSKKDTVSYFNQGAFAEFVVSDDAAYPETSKKSGFWYPWQRQQNVTVYRKGAVSDEEKTLLRSYKGIGDPRFKGRLGILAATVSNSVAGVYVLLKETDSSLWNGIVANKPIVKASSFPMMDGLLSGEYDIALMSGSVAPTRAALQGAPVEFVASTPSPELFSGGAISALAPHPNAARLWADWVLSKEGNDLFVNLTGNISPRTDGAKSFAQQQPWFWEDLSQVRPLDWDDFAAAQPNVIARFQKDIQTR